MRFDISFYIAQIYTVLLIMQMRTRFATKKVMLQHCYALAVMVLLRISFVYYLLRGSRRHNSCTSYSSFSRYSKYVLIVKDYFVIIVQLRRNLILHRIIKSRHVYFRFSCPRMRLLMGQPCNVHVPCSPQRS